MVITREKYEGRTVGNSSDSVIMQTEQREITSVPTADKKKRGRPVGSVVIKKRGGDTTRSLESLWKNKNRREREIISEGENGRDPEDPDDELEENWGIEVFQTICKLPKTPENKKINIFKQGENNNEGEQRMDITDNEEINKRIRNVEVSEENFDKQKSGDKSDALKMGNIAGENIDSRKDEETRKIRNEEKKKDEEMKERANMEVLQSKEEERQDLIEINDVEVLERDTQRNGEDMHEGKGKVDDTVMGPEVDIEDLNDRANKWQGSEKLREWGWNSAIETSEEEDEGENEITISEEKDKDAENNDDGIKNKKLKENNTDKNNNKQTGNSEEELDEEFTWILEMQELEKRMRKLIKTSITGSERLIKRWWRYEVQMINEECRKDCEEEQCEKCEKYREDIREYESKIKEVREKAEEDNKEKLKKMKDKQMEDKKQWEEERRALLKIINKLVNDKDGKDRKGRNEIEPEGNVRINKSVSLDEISLDSLNVSDITKEKGYSTVKEQDNLKINYKEKGNRETNVSWQEVRKKQSRTSMNTKVNNNHESRDDFERKKEIAKRRPAPLTREEIRKEENRKENRRNNIKITFPNEKSFTKEAVMGKITEKCKQNIRRQTKIRHEDKGVTVLKFENRSDKMEILSKSKELKGTDIWMNDDLTKREVEIQKWLREVANNERRNGRTSEVRHMKILLEDKWWKWNEWRGNIEVMVYRNKTWQPFRDEKQRSFKRK